jgi:hypothetical protein
MANPPIGLDPGGGSGGGTGVDIGAFAVGGH